MAISILLHIVQPGETAERIARANNLNVEDLLSLNPSIAGREEITTSSGPSKPRKEDGSLIYPGDVLSIPFNSPQPVPRTVITTNYQDLAQTLISKPLAFKANDRVEFKIPLVGSEYDNLSLVQSLYRVVDPNEANPTSFANITGTIDSIRKVSGNRVEVSITPDLPTNFESFSNHLHEPTHTAIIYNAVDDILVLQTLTGSLDDVLQKVN